MSGLAEALRRSLAELAPYMDNDEPISGSDAVDWLCEVYEDARAALAAHDAAVSAGGCTTHGDAVIARPLPSLRAADVLSPFEAGACEVPVTYGGGTYHVAKGHDAKGGFYYTVRGDQWSGYRIARPLPAVRKLIWDALA